MRNRALTLGLILTLTGGLVTVFGGVVGADHKAPPGPHAANTETSGHVGQTFGTGTWTHISNFPANPGSDFALFRRNRELYASSGTLGQGDTQFVGQRITQLTTNQGTVVNPTWIADHASASCTLGSTGVTGLQHDAAAAGAFRTTSRPTSIPGVQALDTQLIIDTTDATGRCHDAANGGLELVDITNVALPKEIHLTRHTGTSHTVTVDATRPYIVYNSNASFGVIASATAPGSDQNWIDVLDVRPCLNLGNATLAAKRTACRPKVYRINFEHAWTRQRNFYNGGGAIDPLGAGSCHDITAIGTRLYCAALRATIILDVANITDANGNIRGTQLNCPVIDNATAADVTDCGGVNAIPNADAVQGVQFLGTRHHAGLDCTMPPAPRNMQCNSNLIVPVDQDIAIAHEADPTHDEKVMFVTDERGGGALPPGASCTPDGPTDFSNGGMHAFDISGPLDPDGDFPYMLTPSGAKAVFIGAVRVPAPDFCTIHMIEHAHNEQRLFVAYYSQGVKVVDYFFHPNNRISFRETASFVLPNANTWVAHPFKTVDNGDGTKTYTIFASDIERGIDVYTYRNTPNPIGAPPPAEATATIQAGNAGAGLLVLAAALPAASLLRRRRRSRR
ncbi:MAG TPA: hypothetical protein VFH75_06355 [Actinomycetota bacterium]|nr:hypothetical protein [Actinomycetota bacterium]